MLMRLKRWLAYLLVPSGPVLLFVPLNTHRMVETERDVLFLDITGTLADPEIPAETMSPPSTPDSVESDLRPMKERRKDSSEAETLAAALMGTGRFKEASRIRIHGSTGTAPVRFQLDKKNCNTLDM